MKEETLETFPKQVDDVFEIDWRLLICNRKKSNKKQEAFVSKCKTHQKPNMFFVNPFSLQLHNKRSTRR